MKCFFTQNFISKIWKLFINFLCKLLQFCMKNRKTFISIDPTYISSFLETVLFLDNFQTIKSSILYSIHLNSIIWLWDNWDCSTVYYWKNASMFSGSVKILIFRICFVWTLIVLWWVVLWQSIALVNLPGLYGEDTTKPRCRVFQHPKVNEYIQAYRYTEWLCKGIFQEIQNKQSKRPKQSKLGSSVEYCVKRSSNPWYIKSNINLNEPCL